jgi:hypothetical protein
VSTESEDDDIQGVDSGDVKMVESGPVSGDVLVVARQVAELGERVQALEFLVDAMAQVFVLVEVPPDDA